MLLAIILVFATGWWFFRPHPKPAATVVPPKTITAKEIKATVVSPPLRAGDSLTLRLEQPRGRWKAEVLTVKPGSPHESTSITLDAGLGYEILTLNPDIKPITVPLVNWDIGEIDLPEVSLDAVVTPNRVGLGAGIPLTDNINIEAGVSRRWDDPRPEKYIGIGA
jgi:hypothetical protein